MTDSSRRGFLRAALAAGGGALLGTIRLEPVTQDSVCADPLATGRRAGTVPFAGESRNPPFHTRLGSGLDARLYTDMSDLGPDTLITANSRFFVRTGWPDLLDFSGPQPAWTIRVDGLVRRPHTVVLGDLASLAEPAGPFLMECAGNNDPTNFGLMSAAVWTGVPLVKVLERIGPLPRATRVKISGFDGHSHPSARSTPGTAWIFTIDQLESAGAILATGMNSETLPRDHGWPVRLIMPGWYGCACIKWVDALTLVDDTAPATSQMKEFAARTFQDGTPDLARDYGPAAMDLGAVPVRIEKWLLDGQLVYRVVGIVWGGTRATSRLRIRFNSSEKYVPVDVCPRPDTNLTWALWSHIWRPASRGRYHIVLQPGDQDTRSRRLELYFYTRQVWIDEV